MRAASQTLSPETIEPGESRLLTRRHLLIGWWSVFGFGILGLVLELLHGFKIGAYLDAGNETRRLMWTLAHAHGTLLGLIHIAFAATLGLSPIADGKRRLISGTLAGASVLLPGGFFLGGLRFYSGDPGLGIAVVPAGAVLLFTAAWTIARAVSRAGDATVGQKPTRPRASSRE
jgi:hypothetical protein